MVCAGCMDLYVFIAGFIGKLQAIDKVVNRDRLWNTFIRLRSLDIKHR